MAKGKQKQRMFLAKRQKELADAQESDDPTRIALAHAYLGYALVQMNKAKEGLTHFDDALKIADELEDVPLKVRSLGVKTTAFQLVGRLPDAFTAAQEIESIAEDQNDSGMKSDALASQGQILLNSGDPAGALEKFEEALKLATSIEDRAREMNVRGDLANHSMVLTDYNKAGNYFSEAMIIAQELDDRQSEIGYLGNIGSIFEWEREFVRANEAFTEVAAYLQEVGDTNTEPFALQHLIQVNKHLEDHNKVIEYALRGIEITRKEKPAEALHFYQEIVATYYRLNKYEEGNTATIEAIELAQESKEREKEVDFQLSLGEAYMLTEKLDEAMEIYQQALYGTQRLQRHVDRAHLLGRIGFILAETGNFDEAIAKHEEAIKFAKRNELADFEGEQLSMLALAYRDKGDTEQALEYAKQSLQIYTDAELPKGAEKVNRLLAELDSSQKTS